MNRTEIEQSIPHKGDMCLLDAVVERDDQFIRCTTDSHRRSDNPLRDDDGLPVTAALEYAAQAMAIHAASGANPNSNRGMLVSVRELNCNRRYLHTIQAPLLIEAYLQAASPAAFNYSFVVSAAGAVIAAGSATIAIAGG